MSPEDGHEMGLLGKAKLRVRFYPQLAPVQRSRLVPVASSGFQDSAIGKTGVCTVSSTS